MASLSKTLARNLRRRLLCLSLERPLLYSHLNRIPRRHSSNSTQHSANLASTRHSGNLSYHRGIFALSCIFSGIIGFTLAKTWTSPSEEAGSIGKPRYGTPKDFERAIQELKEAFPDADAVSTDPEDLRIHGFSDYDWRPGTWYPLLLYLKTQ